MQRITLAILILTFCPVLASAGVIRGTVVVSSGGPRATRAANPYPGRVSAMSASAGAVHGLLADAVIQVDHVPAATESALTARVEPMPRLAQREQTFAPRVTVVAVGSRVDFPNMDPIYHNVFSVSPTRRFDLGKYPRGQSRSITFHKPGLVNVFCDIHSDMAAFILVVPNRHFTRPAADGSFDVSELPPGRYHVRAWHPDFTPRDLEIVVPASGDVTLDVSF